MRPPPGGATADPGRRWRTSRRWCHRDRPDCSREASLPCLRSGATGRATTATSVRGVLHPVGRLPAAVYWRRRLMVLVLLLAVLGGGGWLGFVALTGRGLDGTP